MLNHKLRTWLFKIVVAWAIFSVHPAASAQSIELQAITDFPDLTSGEVPYYIDTVGERNVLAINAANVEYRDKYARAVTTFNGASGTYDVTITALGEIDGEGEFRFLINGVLAGSAFNTRVDVDWGEQFHTFDDIGLNAGDEIAVESSALSNGLIPENGEYAFARGRWRSLTLTLDDGTTAVAETADLQVEASTVSVEIESGATQSVPFTLSNLTTDVVATNINLQLSATDGISTELSNGAVVTELAGGETVDLAVDVTALSPGSATLTLYATADQADPESGNNSATQSVTVTTIENAVEEEVTATDFTEASDTNVTADETTNDPTTMTAAQATTDNPFATAATTASTATAAGNSATSDTADTSNSGGGGSLSMLSGALLLLHLISVIAVRRYSRSRRW